MAEYLFHVRESRAYSVDYVVSADSPEEAMAKYKAQSFRRAGEVLLETYAFIDEIVELSPDGKPH